MAADQRRSGPRLLKDPVAHANDVVPILLSLENDKNEEQAIEKLRIAKTFFEKVKRDGLGRRRTSSSGPADTAFENWLKRQFRRYKACVLGILSGTGSPGLKRAALIAVMAALTYDAETKFDSDFFSDAFLALTAGDSPGEDVFRHFVTEYLCYIDVRYYSLQAVSDVCGAQLAREGEADGQNRQPDDCSPASEVGSLAVKLYDVLVAAAPEGDEGDQKSWCAALEADLVSPAKRRKRRQEGTTVDVSRVVAEPQAVRWASPRFQRKAYSTAWLSFLRLKLPDHVLRKVLVRLHADVMPHIVNPHLLADFFARAVDRGGLLGILALHGLFVLVTKHGFEYPQFYARLYDMLEPAVFQAQHRVQFFQLVDIFLASAKVPAYTAAGFIKRFARLSLSISPAGALVALAFIHNLLRRHPAVQALIDRASQMCPASGAGEDVYDYYKGLAESSAHESSLWEVETLRNHYCPEVALAASTLLTKDLADKKKTAEIDCSSLLSGSYASMVLAEGKRRIKAVPTCYFSILPTGLGVEGATPHLAWS